jgi:hypothetical protein
MSVQEVQGRLGSGYVLIERLLILTENDATHQSNLTTTLINFLQGVGSLSEN